MHQALLCTLWWKFRCTRVPGACPVVFRQSNCSGTCLDQPCITATLLRASLPTLSLCTAGKGAKKKKKKLKPYYCHKLGHRHEVVTPCRVLDLYEVWQLLVESLLHNYFEVDNNIVNTFLRSH